MNPGGKPNKKQRIIETAIRLVSEKGYHRTTTSMIAKRAGVSQGIIFHYFKSKENLFLTLLRESSDKLLLTMEERIKGEKDTLKKVKGIIEAYLELAEKEEKLFRLFTREVRNPELSTKKLERMGVERPFDFIKEIIKQGMREGVVRRTDADAATLCLLGMIDYTVLGWMMEEKKFPLPKSSQMILNFFLKGLLSK